MKLKTTLIACAAFLSASSAFAAVTIGSLTTNSSSAGTIQLDNDIIFTAASGFSFDGLMVLGIEAGYVGSPVGGNGSPQTGTSASIAGSINTSAPYNSSVFVASNGPILDSMIILLFTNSSETLVANDTVTFHSGSYSVAFIDDPNVQNLNLTLTDDAIAFTNGIGNAYSGAINVVPEPSTYAVIGGLAALGLALWRRRVTN